MRTEAKPLLSNWGMELIRDQIIQAFASVSDGTTTANFGDASEVLKDAWSVNNEDRILYTEPLSLTSLVMFLLTWLRLTLLLIHSKQRDHQQS